MLDEVFDGGRTGEGADKSFQHAGYPFWVLLSFFEFFPHRGRVDLSEQRLQGGLAVQEDFEVLRVLEIVNQRGVRQHGAQGLTQRLATGFVAATAFEIAKEPLHKIVGSLGLDRAGAVWGGNDQRGREQLGAVALDLLDHLLQSGRGRVIGTRSHVLCPGLNFSLKSVHLDQLAIMIESLASGHWGDVRSLAELIEQRAMGFQQVEGAAQRAIMDWSWAETSCARRASARSGRSKGKP